MLPPPRPIISYAFVGQGQPLHYRPLCHHLCGSRQTRQEAGLGETQGTQKKRIDLLDF